MRDGDNWNAAPRARHSERARVRSHEQTLQRPDGRVVHRAVMRPHHLGQDGAAELLRGMRREDTEDGGAMSATDELRDKLEHANMEREER